MNLYYITGTSSGLGLAIANLLLEQEDNVIVGISRRIVIQEDALEVKPDFIATSNFFLYLVLGLTKKLAEKVAADLKFITGQSWRVKSGDASDMTPTKALYRIDIHYPI